jgi:hypothetical protein
MTEDSRISMNHLLRITCRDHGILSESVWTEADGQNAVQQYLEHVVKAHREPYGAYCTTGWVEASLFDGDRAPVVIVWAESQMPHERTIAGVFALQEDADRFIESQRDPVKNFTSEEHNVLHFVPAEGLDPTNPEPTEEPTPA